MVDSVYKCNLLKHEEKKKLKPQNSTAMFKTREKCLEEFNYTPLRSLGLPVRHLIYHSVTDLLLVPCTTDNALELKKTIQRKFFA